MAGAGRLRFGRSGGSPSDLNINFGIRTPNGWGAYTVAETPAGTITSANGGASDWVIDADGRLAPSGTYATTSTPKTYSKAAGETYNLTLPSGRLCNVTLVANTVHLQSRTGDAFNSNSARTLSARAYNLAGNLRLGDTVIWRDDATFSSTSSAWSLAPPAAGYNGAGTIVGGSGYTNATYQNVPLTGGSGTGALARITVASGAVACVHINNPGSGYLVGDVLSASAANLGGAGSGFTLTVIDLNGRITWRGETAGNIVSPAEFADKGGLFNAIFIGINADSIASVSMIPYDFRYITFYAAVQPTSIGLNNAGNIGASNAIYGASSYDCFFSIDPDIVPVAQRVKTAWTNFRGGIVDGCVFRGVERPITGGHADYTVPTIVRNTICTVVSGDSVQWAIGSLGILIEDFISYIVVYTSGEHPDAIQHLGFAGTWTGTGYTSGSYSNIALEGTGGITGVLANVTVNGSGAVTFVNITNPGNIPTGVSVVLTLVVPTSIGASGTGFTHTTPGTVTNFGTYRRCAFFRDASITGGLFDAQGYFNSDGRAVVSIQGATMENCIFVGTATNGMTMTRFADPQISLNTIIFAVGSGVTPVVSPIIHLDRGTDGLLLQNLACNIDYASQTGTVTDTDNVEITPDSGAYATMFSAYTYFAETLAAARLAVAPNVGVPVASGGAMLPDGRYVGAVFPDGSWNDGTVYVP